MRHESLEEHWTYNCEDTVRTLECALEEKTIIEKLNLQSPEAMQQSMFFPVLQAMIRGVRVDLNQRSRLSAELSKEIENRKSFFNQLLDHPLNPASTKQMQALFYDDLKQKVILNRKTKQPTLDDNALTLIGQREPLLQPLLKKISEYRTLGVFLSTFVNAPLDEDSRLRCSYNICGTETYRLASRKNAFDSGTNLQNIPGRQDENDGLQLPNIRTLFIPDEGFCMFDADLDRADLQVVVWEADDRELKQMLHEGVDIHAENAKVLGSSRQMAKSFIHGTNYGGGPRTMALNCAITVAQAEKMQSKWFQAHPGIKQWHLKTEGELRSRHYVENKFGYRRFYFDRIEGLLPEALAWIPQSTVAITINKVWLNIFNNLPEVEILMQLHDSLIGQVPISQLNLLEKIKEQFQVKIPYSEPLVIPFSIKTSKISWGDCS